MTSTLHIPDDVRTLTGDDAILLYLQWRRRYMAGRPRAEKGPSVPRPRLRQESD